MLSLRNRFGIPGVISVIALVFAMLGGAYAASNNGGGKATASAKAKRGPKGPKGATGPAGPAGPQGPAGANGKDGSNGSAGLQGSQGLPGKSVAVNSYSGPECAGSEEGATVEVSGEPATKKYVCDGEEGVKGPKGDPWTAGGTLPPSTTPGCPCTETGTWAVGYIPAAGERQWFSISFDIPLASDLSIDKAHYINKFGKEIFLNESFVKEELASHPSCPGTAVEPAALTGNLCVYASEEGGLESPSPNEGIFGGALYSSFHNATGEGLLVSTGVSRTGASVLVGASAAEAFGRGTWAVTG